MKMLFVMALMCSLTQVHARKKSFIDSKVAETCELAWDLVTENVHENCCNQFKSRGAQTRCIGNDNEYISGATEAVDSGSCVATVHIKCNDNLF